MIRVTYISTYTYTLLQPSGGIRCSIGQTRKMAQAIRLYWEISEERSIYHALRSQAHTQSYSKCIQEYQVWLLEWVVGSSREKQLAPGFGGFFSATGIKPTRKWTIEYFCRKALLMYMYLWEMISKEPSYCLKNFLIQVTWKEGTFQVLEERVHTD